MKTAEIQNDTDYIVGPSRNLWEGVGRYVADGDDYVPYNMKRVRVVDRRPHKVWTSYGGRERRTPQLVAEGEKPDRSYYAVGPLVRYVKSDGTDAATPHDPLVLKPQDFRMEFDVWREQFSELHAARKEADAKALAARKEADEAKRIVDELRSRRLKTFDSVLAGSPIQAIVVGGEIVLTGDPDELLQAARKLSIADGFGLREEVR